MGLRNKLLYEIRSDIMNNRQSSLLECIKAANKLTPHTKPGVLAYLGNFRASTPDLEIQINANVQYLCYELGNLDTNLKNVFVKGFSEFGSAFCRESFPSPAICEKSLKDSGSNLMAALRLSVALKQTLESDIDMLQEGLNKTKILPKEMISKSIESSSTAFKDKIKLSDKEIETNEGKIKAHTKKLSLLQILAQHSIIALQSIYSVYLEDDVALREFVTAESPSICSEAYNAVYSAYNNAYVKTGDKTFLLEALEFFRNSPEGRSSTSLLLGSIYKNLAAYYITRNPDLSYENYVKAVNHINQLSHGCASEDYKREFSNEIMKLVVTLFYNNPKTQEKFFPATAASTETDTTAASTSQIKEEQGGKDDTMCRYY